MKILMIPIIKKKNYEFRRDGVFTYIKDLSTVLKGVGHTVYDGGISTDLNGLEKLLKLYSDCDIVFTNQLFQKYDNYDIFSPVVRHVHNFNTIRLDSKLLYESWYLLEKEIPIFTVNSEYQRQQFINSGYPFDMSKIFILPNCVDENFYKKTKAKKIKKSILYLGRVEKANFKTLIPLVKAMPKLKEYHLNIVGYIDKEDKKEVERSIKSKNINFLGEYTENKKLSIINRHELGIGVGRSMMEMVLCGLPVLLFKIGFAGWVTENNVEKLRKDNYTTRDYKEVGENEKIDKIIEEIISPKTMPRDIAVREFGLNFNIYIYENLFKLLTKGV